MQFLVEIMSPRKHHFSDSFPYLVCQIGTQLADHLGNGNNDIKGAKRKANFASRITFEETFLKAKLWARRAGDRVDAVVEALVGKVTTVRVKLIVGQQGVVDGSNPLLFTTFLRLNLANAGEEEKEEGY